MQRNKVQRKEMQRSAQRLTDGFTIIEVLMAVVLLTITVVAILSPLTGLFGLSQQSGQQVNVTNAAQAAIEQVRGEWLIAPKYSSGCVAGALPEGITVQVQDMTSGGSANGSPYALAVTGTACGTTPPNPDTSAPYRQVSVTATRDGRSTTFEVEVAHP